MSFDRLIGGASTPVRIANGIMVALVILPFVSLFLPYENKLYRDSLFEPHHLVSRTYGYESGAWLVLGIFLLPVLGLWLGHSSKTWMRIFGKVIAWVAGALLLIMIPGLFFSDAFNEGLGSYGKTEDGFGLNLALIATVLFVLVYLVSVPFRLYAWNRRRTTA
jgi:hypothetical protein